MADRIKKADLIAYARNFGTGQSTISTRNQTNDTGIDSTTTIARQSVWRANAGDDEPTPISSEFTEGIQYSGSGAIGSEQGEDGGFEDSERSSDGVTWDDGNDYQPTRNHYGSSNQSNGTVPRTTVKRTSVIDELWNKVYKPKKEQQPKQQKIISTTARRLLTIAEVQRDKPRLIRLILITSEHMDTGISAITKGHKEVSIWSNIEYSDAEILADGLLESGQRSQWVAEKVRILIDYERKIQRGMILLPRTYKTIMYIITTGLDLRLM